MRHDPLAAIVMVIAGATALAGVQTNVDLPAIDEALTLIRSGSASELARFNEPYRVKVEKAPVDYLEVVTPFRRIVLAGTAKVAVGDRSFGQRQAIESLSEGGDRLDVYAELTLSPLNTYIGVPDYVVALIDRAGTRIEATGTTRLSRWTPRLPGPPAVAPFQTPTTPRGSPLIGATVIAGFDLKMLAPAATYDVIVELGKEELAREGIALGGMR
jgi:hypothetical protein